jgi:IS30 family transposase
MIERFHMSKYKHFSKVERLELSILLKKGYSMRAIAEALKRSHSSVVRELKRNSVNGVYDPSKAQHKAYVKRREAKFIGMKVRGDPKIEEYIWEKMPLGWSPGCIVGRIYRERGISISHLSIYKYLYNNPYGNYLCKYLTYKRYNRKKRRNKKTVREMIPNRVWIDGRPDIVNSRGRFGDFEADTMGKPKSASQETLAVVRERKSRKMFAVKVPRLKYAMEGFKRILSPYYDIVESVTMDNGVENVRHAILKLITYFCHPYSSWEKGGVENGIGLIREYIPKKSDLKDYSEEYIGAVLDRINNTPMKCLDWLTPNEVFAKELWEKRARRSILKTLIHSLQLTYQQWCT